MQKDIAKGRGLLTILILSFSYPYISLHIMTLVTKRIVETILVPLNSDFLGDCAHSVPPSRPHAQLQHGGQQGQRAVGQQGSGAAHPPRMPTLGQSEEGSAGGSSIPPPRVEKGEGIQWLQTLSFPAQPGCLVDPL